MHFVPALLLLVTLLQSDQLANGHSSKSYDGSWKLVDVIGSRDDIACSPNTRPRELTDGSGWFTSENYPDDYTNNANCQWLIKSAENATVELSFVDFETEVLRDRVILYDGDTTAANVIAEFYGTYVTLPVEIRSTGQFMLVVFTSDFSVTKRGFNATYSPYVYVDPPPDPCNPLTRPVEVTQYNGTFQSNNFPDEYWNLADCQWLFVSQEPDGIVEINFDVFATERNYDFVRLYDGTSVSAPLIAAVHGSPDPPLVFQSTQQYLFMRFTSDSSIADIGFNGTFASLPAPTPGPSTEPTVTTVSTTATTTITARPPGPCGTILSASPDDAVVAPRYDLMCQLDRTDEEFLGTQCYDLIQNLPGFGDAEQLVRLGGNFGCFLTTSDDYSDSVNACHDSYQWLARLEQCRNCPRLFVCIRVK